MPVSDETLYGPGSSTDGSITECTPAEAVAIEKVMPAHVDGLYFI
jgi:hypothetical protein